MCASCISLLIGTSGFMGSQMDLKVCGLKLGLTGTPSPLVFVKVKVVCSDKLCCQPV